MIGLRAKLALAGALLASTAAAQTPAANAPPQTIGGPATVVPAPAASAPKDSGIEVSTLGAPEGPPAGLLNQTNGGMADDIWTGSPRAAIEDLLARMPLATPIRSVRGLGRKLLLTKADAPVGQAPRMFQTVRIQTLLTAGFVSDTAKLAALIQMKDDPEFSRLQATAILLGGKPADACGDATASRETNAEPFWMQLRAYCYAMGGKSDLLEMTRDVMKAQGADDKAFEILLDDVLAHKATPPGMLHDPTAVQVLLMRQVGIPINPSLAARFGLAASVLALRDAKNSPQARADAASQAMHAGAASSAELNAIADAQAFTPQQFANAGTAAEGLPFFAGQALIRQAVARAANDDDKAKLLATAFRLGRQSQLLPVAAAIQEKGAVLLAPTPTMRSFAPGFAQALLLVRQADAAERWRDMLDMKTDADRLLAASLAVQLYLVAPNPGRAGRAQEALSVLAQNTLTPQPIGGFEAKEFAALALGLYDALGEPMPPDASAQLANLTQHQLPGRRLPPLVAKHLADMKGQPGMEGEALLTILDGVGAGGPADLAPDQTAAFVRSLKDWGEGEAARAFAVDALALYRPQPQPS
ncbi:MAG TPA: hypothetical protein VMD53_07965 [Rhizomicrobium sp.]|nr:hypothetical protein [Rhizomicrobium sp.]